MFFKMIVKYLCQFVSKMPRGLQFDNSLTGRMPFGYRNKKKQILWQSQQKDKLV